MSEDLPAPQAMIVTEAPAGEAVLPRHATYRCDDGTSLAVDVLAASVVVTSGDDERVDLPALPAGSSGRYGAGAYVLVLDDNEALWMKAGKEPATCLP